MLRFGCLLLVLSILLLAGCCPSSQRTMVEQEMFGAISFRLHPTFTQIKTWTGGPKHDGIEAVAEFQDQFGDPNRAAGTVRFELYTFRPSEPDHRGLRIATWTGSIESKQDQIAHWDPAARGYSFQLAYAKIQNDHAYVLTAQFDRAGKGGRMFDQIVLEPSAKEGYHGDRRTQRAPTNAPGHNIAY